KSILQRDGSRYPEIILVSRHALGKVAVKPAIEHAQLGFETAQDQEMLEYLGRLRHKIGIEQIRHQRRKPGMQIVSPLPDREHANADQYLPSQRAGPVPRLPHGLRPLTNSSPSECQICWNNSA